MKELTEKQRGFAEKHHGLVYSFLNSRKLSEDEFYDIVIFGYLRAVQRYDEEPKLRQYAFSTIAFRAMESKVGHYYQSKRAKKRDANVFSLDYSLNRSGTLTFGDVLEDRNNNVCDTVCVQDALERTAKPFGEMVAMRMDGYSDAEIAKQYQVTQTDIKDCFAELYANYSACMAA